MGRQLWQLKATSTWLDGMRKDWKIDIAGSVKIKQLDGLIV